MKYTIEINRPIEKVYDLFTDRDNLKKWQSKLLDYQHLHGEKGEVGSVSELTYKGLTIFETITSKVYPTEVISEYEHKRNAVTKMYHTAMNKFSKLGNDKTLYEMTIEQKVVGFLPQIVMTIMAGTVKKYHKKLLKGFKKFAEKQ